MQCFNSYNGRRIHAPARIIAISSFITYRIISMLKTQKHVTTVLKKQFSLTAGETKTL